MFANYTGKRGRSMSTTDVYHVGRDDDDDDDDDDEASARRSFSTLLRRQIRRPSKPPPVPPKRSDSFSSDSSSSSSSTTLTRVRSYLSDDIRREFESTMARVDEEPRSPSSSSFVKKLVATLERRQKDVAVRSASPDIFKHATFRELSRQDRSLIASPRKEDEEEEDGARVVQPPMDFSPRIRHLEELHEAANEEEEEEEEEKEEAAEDDVESSDSSDDYIADMWPTRAPPRSVVGDPEQEKSKRKSTSKNRRRLKSVISSLMNWRIGGKANLPKGSRDYYATRESLGEELRAFRRDTMPRLMEHAAVNGRLPFAQQRAMERPRRDTQDFAKLIRRAGNEALQPPRTAVASPRCVATIHPIYGACRATVPARLRVETVVAPKQPQPTATATTVISDEHLLRPSRLRDLQKRLSREIDTLATVQLRASSVASMHYAVPKSNRPVIVEEYTEEVHYQNIGQAVSHDQRLSCTMFTTF